MIYQKLTINDIQQNEQLFKIWTLVCQAHKGQKRKGTVRGVHPDYTSHLFKVMEIMANVLGNPKNVLQDKKFLPLLAIALTHDIIEDTAIDSKEKLAGVLEPILGAVGAKNVAFVVGELSNPKQGFLGNTKQEQDIVKKIWQINHVKEISVFAKMVKMADQIANIVDCVDINMTIIDKQGHKRELWTDEKKKFYAVKALSVCRAALIGVQNISDKERLVFKNLMDLADAAYDYGVLKIKSPLVEQMDFYDTLHLHFQQVDLFNKKTLLSYCVKNNCAKIM